VESFKKFIKKKKKNNASGEATINHSNRGGNLVAWSNVQNPKTKGGLGI